MFFVGRTHTAAVLKSRQSTKKYLFCETVRSRDVVAYDVYLPKTRLAKKSELKNSVKYFFTFVVN